MRQYISLTKATLPMILKAVSRNFLAAHLEAATGAAYNYLI